MKLPFTSEQFLQVFEKYNLAIFPFQVILYLLAGMLVFFATNKTKHGDKIISAILSFFWLWMGVVYHLVFFSVINKIAILFGSLFIIQSLLFFYYGVIKNRLSFAFKKDPAGFAGALLLTYSLFIYPVLANSLGHQYPSHPGFGLPCPTTIFSFGILLWTDKKLNLSILLIPLAWSIIGMSAAINLGMTEDFGLVIAGMISFIFIVLQNRNFHHPTKYSLRG